MTRFRFRPACLLFAASALLGACAAPPVPSAEAAADRPLQPEASSGVLPRAGHASQRFAVATANPLATRAAYEMLRDGGSAIDAAVAAQMVLMLVEPQSSGIGGGALMVYWDGRETFAIDGRETAPAAADERLFLGADGRPLPFAEVVAGGRSVGTPGVLRALEMAHRADGRLPWARLFEPAIRLADDGFPLGARLHGQLADDPHLRQDPTAAAYFYRADGSPHPVGTRLRNPELASTLRLIADHGPDAFYDGALARDIVAKVRGHAGNPGRLTEDDLRHYVAKRRDALCTEWRQFRLCGVPPPSSGHIAIAQMLGILEALPDAGVGLKQGIPSADFLHRYTEAARLAFADRAQYVADPDFVPAPGGTWYSLVDPAYLAERARLVGPVAMTAASPGRPAGTQLAFAPMPPQPEHGTSDLAIVDAQGHALAMTTTIEDQFGARQMVHGFLLNNQLTDFSFAPADAEGRPIANRVEPGKRPRSSMSPTLVFDAKTGRLLMSAGSAGGALIIHYTAKTLLASLAWGLDAQAAVALPNFGSLGGSALLEQGRYPGRTIATLKALGHAVRELEMTSGSQAVQRAVDGWFGGSDPRREGVVMGD